MCLEVVWNLRDEVIPEGLLVTGLVVEFQDGPELGGGNEVVAF